MEEKIITKLREVTKTPHSEIMCLPYGNANPVDVINWIINMSDEEFDALMASPIIIQAKIFYSKIRKERK